MLPWKLLAIALVHLGVKDLDAWLQAAMQEIGRADNNKFMHSVHRLRGRCAKLETRTDDRRNR